MQLAARRRADQSEVEGESGYRGRVLYARRASAVRLHRRLRIHVESGRRLGEALGAGDRAADPPRLMFGSKVASSSFLILRRLRSSRLEGWPRTPSLRPSFETRRSRGAPQDE